MGINEKIKSMVNNESLIIKFLLTVYNHIPFNNTFKLRKNKLQIVCAKLKKSKLNIKGKNNEIKIGRGSRLTDCKIHIYGSSNTVMIDNFVALNGVEIWIEDNDNYVVIGEHSSFEGNIHLACIEGTSIEIGKDCMFSANISLRTGDSHSVVDMNHDRINPSRSIIIGNHVWIGNTVLINKGVRIPDNSIVGTGSVVTKAFDCGNVVIAGNPSKIVKEGISWERERLPVYKQQ